VAVAARGAAVRPTEPVDAAGALAYPDIGPQLPRAGSLTPIEKAKRRVLFLCNPGLGWRL